MVTKKLIPKKKPFQKGDWVVCDIRVGQLKEVKGEFCEFSDGSFCLSGGTLLNRCRPLTLRNKAIVESFDYYYSQLRKIDGEAGFNYPDIHRYFEQLSLDAIDNEDNKKFYDAAQEFVREASDYKSPVPEVRLFRRSSN